MIEVGVHEAKTQLSRLLRRVELGEEVLIYRGGKLVAKLVAPDIPTKPEWGLDAGKFHVPDPLWEPGEVEELFGLNDDDDDDVV
jgi:antitoxin (DNA-binding transcriptional repressor) of toxin-antitoxin stability system